MKNGLIVALLSIALVGCSGLDSLLNGKVASRSNDYEASEPLVPRERIEPYGVFVGHSKYGDKIYLIHWAGNSLDKQGLLESIVDAMNIKKYEN